MSASLAPRAPEGMAAGAAISVVAHTGLVVALALAVQWRLPAPQPVAAELWSALPQSAAPPATDVSAPAPAAPPAEPPQPAPLPEPAEVARAAAAQAERARETAREAQIAVERKAQEERVARERAQREKAALEKAAREKAALEKAAREKADRAKAERAEQQRLERERAQQQKAELADKARQHKAERAQADRQKAQQVKAEEAQLARQREENLRRLMGQIPAGAGAAGAGSATADAAPSASYSGRLVQAIFPNIVFTSTLPGNPAAVVEVRAGPNGTVIGRRLVSSSGHPEWDEAVLRAIDRTGTLPRDADGRVPPVIEITFRPR